MPKVHEPADSATLTALPGVAALFPDFAGSQPAASATVLPGPCRKARGAGRADANTLTAPPPSRHTGKSASTPGQAPSAEDARRRWRYARRQFLWMASGKKKVRQCGRVRLDGDTVIRVREGRAHYSGFRSCADVWACPVCSAKIRNTRAAEIADAAARWQVPRYSIKVSTPGQADEDFPVPEGIRHSVYMLTLTVPHDAGMPLDMLWSVIGRALQGVRSGRAYQRLKYRAGIGVTATAKELTHGSNGWHPHIHMLLFTSYGHDPGQFYGLLSYFRQAWAREVVRAGLGEPDRLHGVRLDECYSGTDAGLYLAKVQDGRSVGNEVARGDLKPAGEGHRTPFEILADLERFGLVSDRDLWAEYERVMHGKRAIVWSRGYREILSMDPEQTDEEIAAAEVGGQAVAVLSAETWQGVAWRSRVSVPWSDAKLTGPVALLEAAERGGLAVVNDLLAALGVPLARAPTPRADDDVGDDWVDPALWSHLPPRRQSAEGVA